MRRTTGAPAGSLWSRNIDRIGDAAKAVPAPAQDARVEVDLAELRAAGVDSGMGHSDGKGCGEQEEEHGGRQELDKGVECPEEQDDSVLDVG